MAGCQGNTSVKLHTDANDVEVTTPLLSENRGTKHRFRLVGRGLNAEAVQLSALLSCLLLSFFTYYTLQLKTDGYDNFLPLHECVC